MRCSLGRQVVSLGGRAARGQLFLLYHGERTSCIVHDSFGKRDGNEKDVSIVMQQIRSDQTSITVVMDIKRLEEHLNRYTSSSRQCNLPTFLWSIQDNPICVGGIFPWSNPWAGLCNCTGVPWKVFGYNGDIQYHCSCTIHLSDSI